MRLFDTHAHLSDTKFDQDREELIQALPNKGVELVVECATEPNDWEAVQKLSQHDIIYVAYGTHPHSASQMMENNWERLKTLFLEKKCVAVGEIGLDYHYDFSPREVQKEVLCRQLDLAIEYNLPVILHDREAHQDLLNLLAPYKGKLRGVMHCYSGSAEMVRDVLDLGLYIGFGGALTFKNAKKPRSAAKAVPLDRLLIETDSPYMTPEPYRGKRNDPAYVRFACLALAELFGRTPEDMAEITMENGKRLFRIEDTIKSC